MFKQSLKKLLMLIAMSALLISLIPAWGNNLASAAPPPMIYGQPEAYLCDYMECAMGGLPYQNPPAGESYRLNGGQLQFSVDVPVTQNYRVTINSTFSGSDATIRVKNMYFYGHGSEVLYHSVKQLSNSLTLEMTLKAGPGTNYISISHPGTNSSISIGSKISVQAMPKVSYAAHWDRIGWVSSYIEGDIAVASPTKLEYLQAVTFSLDTGLNIPPGAQLQYRAHVGGLGWLDWVPTGRIAGTTGQHRRLEAIEMRLINAPNHQIRYRVFDRNLTPQAWKVNGEMAGTTGQHLPLYGIEAEIEILPNLAILQNPQSGKNLDVYGAGTADGTRLQIWHIGDLKHQKFKFVDNGDGYFRIVDLNSGKPLDIKDVSTANGAFVHIWTSYNTNSQLWKVIKNNDGTHKFINKLNGKALDVSGGNTAAGTPVHMWDDNGSGAQKWRISPVLK
ncbi:RICIN domain-containing protein [Paenibacillus sp. GCM10027627]|uniref:RICIN domain-containing protein n=1 Tax=unclassified Paenibacillus TaxID=185978 RepID=UPI0036286113